MRLIFGSLLRLFIALSVASGGVATSAELEAENVLFREFFCLPLALNGGHTDVVDEDPFSSDFVSLEEQLAERFQSVRDHVSPIPEGATLKLDQDLQVIEAVGSSDFLDSMRSICPVLVDFATVTLTARVYESEPTFGGDGRTARATRRSRRALHLPDRQDG